MAALDAIAAFCEPTPEAGLPLLVLPHLAGAPWAHLVNNLEHLGTHSAARLFDAPLQVDATCQYDVYIGRTRPSPGLLASAALPAPVRKLHDPAASPHLTFLFRGHAASLPAPILYDGGASASFVDLGFAKRQNLHIHSDPLEVQLADGNKTVSPGTVEVKLHVQAYRGTVRLRALDLAPDFAVVLGDDWGRSHSVVADYGRDPAVDPTATAHEPPVLHVRRKKLRLFPHPHAAPPARAPGCEKLLSARAAARLLEAPRTGCRPAFLCMVRAHRDDAPAQDVPAQLERVLAEYEDVFAQPSGGIDVDSPPCVPTPGEARPPNRAAFRLSMAERQELENRIALMLELGWIQPSSSAYGAPVLFVPKPDGTLRMCIDYRALNKITTKNKYPIPLIEDLLDNLAGAKYFSALDLTAGYHQLRLCDDDIPKTAFNTHIGKFEWKVLPMGLSNAPSVFQAVMNKIFGPHLNKFVCVYLDDILVFSRTPEEHVEHVALVLALLRKYKLKAKLSKCEFFKPELKFLGHIVSTSGMKPDPAKVKVVRDWPVPQSEFDVRAFLGLTNYFSKYIRAYSATAAPLSDLLVGISAKERTGKLLRRGRLSPQAVAELHSDFAARWSPAAQRAFDTLKEALMTAPVLTLPNFDQPFEVVADACTTAPAVGAVLLQDGRPVAYHSRKLAGAESRYAPTDIEMLAVIDALKQWRCYLAGPRPFTIVTDHKPNIYADKPTNAHCAERRARWLDICCGYNYEWVYRPGRLNVADPISRAPQHFAFVRLCAVTAVARSVEALRAERTLLPPLALSELVPHAAQQTRGKRKESRTFCMLRCHLGATTRSRVRVQPAAGAQGPDASACRTPAKGGANDPAPRLERVQSRDADLEPSDDDGVAYPEASPDDQREIGSFLAQNFIQRMCRGYAEEESLPLSARSMSYRTDSDGLIWTPNERLYVPNYDNLRFECFESVHKHPFCGHYGSKRTSAKASTLY